MRSQFILFLSITLLCVLGILAYCSSGGWGVDRSFTRSNGNEGSQGDHDLAGHSEQETPAPQRVAVPHLLELYDVGARDVVRNFEFSVSLREVNNGAGYLARTDDRGKFKAPQGAFTVQPVMSAAFDPVLVECHTAGDRVEIQGYCFIHVSGVGITAPIEIITAEDQGALAEMCHSGKVSLSASKIVYSIEGDDLFRVATSRSDYCLIAPGYQFVPAHPLFVGEIIPKSLARERTLVFPEFSGAAWISSPFRPIGIGSTLDFDITPVRPSSSIEVDLPTPHDSGWVTLIAEMPLTDTLSQTRKRIDDRKATSGDITAAFDDVGDGNYHVQVALRHASELRLSSSPATIAGNSIQLSFRNGEGAYELFIDGARDNLDLVAVECRSVNRLLPHVPVHMPLSEIDSITGIAEKNCRLWLKRNDEEDADIFQVKVDLGEKSRISPSDYLR